jgi:low molecular weight phosphotyrosine protein phosphatase
LGSAGTASYHVGSPSDSRAARTCAKYGVPINHRARQVTDDDFENFDFLLAMDTSNLEDLEEILESFDKSKHTKLGKGIFWIYAY